MMKPLRRNQAFTLIELLVVCGIISILAVIALPNFSEAQTRTKVAVTKNNLRTVSHKFEMLNVDTNRYPLAGRWRQILLWQVPNWLNDPVLEDRFTKAYSYMYGKHEDIFEFEALKRRGMQDYEWLAVNEERKFLCHGFSFFHPANMQQSIECGVDWQGKDLANWKALTDLAGGWVLYSPGPDLVIESPAWITSPGWGRGETGDSSYMEKNLFREYDPTNGTVSYGNVFRSQKNSAGLGSHEQFN